MATPGGQGGHRGPPYENVETATCREIAGTPQYLTLQPYGFVEGGSGFFPAFSALRPPPT
jgi:hypothetical protein